MLLRLPGKVFHSANKTNVKPKGDGRHALARFAAGLVSIGAAGLGLLWVAFDRDRLSLHDRLSGTVLEMVSAGE